jgi:hypothetical protein
MWHVVVFLCHNGTEHTHDLQKPTVRAVIRALLALAQV